MCVDVDVCVGVSCFRIGRMNRRKESSGKRDVNRRPFTMGHGVNRIVDDVLNQRLTIPADVAVAT